MRYRVMVFDPASAPGTAAGFMAWVRTPTWTEHTASDPGTTLVTLFVFLSEALRFGGQKNTGALAHDTGGHVLVEHQVAKGMIQLVFETSNVRALSETLREMAAQHGVGFFELGVGDEAPTPTSHVTQVQARKPWWKIW